jgi:hypothetical protein
VAVCLVLGAYPLYFQFLGPQRLGAAVHPTGTFVADAAAMVVPGIYQHFSTPQSQQLTAHFTGNVWENSGYLGVPLIALVVIGAVALRRRSAMRVALLAAVVSIVLSFGPSFHVNGVDTHIPMPWRIFQGLPLAANLLPARFAMITYLAVAAVVALLVDAAMRRRGWSMLPVGALSIAALASLLPALPFSTAPAAVPRFFVSADVDRIPAGTVALVAPFINGSHAEAAIWQAAAHMRFRTFEGWAFWRMPDGSNGGLAPETLLGNTLQGYADKATPFTSPAPDSRRRMLSELRGYKVQTIIVGPGAGRPQSVALISELLGRAPEAVGGVDVWWDVVAAPAVG